MTHLEVNKDKDQNNEMQTLSIIKLNKTVAGLFLCGLTLRMRLRSHWVLSEWIATVLSPVTLATASHSRSAPSLQSTNTTTGGWYSLLSWKNQNHMNVPLIWRTDTMFQHTDIGVK